MINMIMLYINYIYKTNKTFLGVFFADELR